MFNLLVFGIELLGALLIVLQIIVVVKFFRIAGDINYLRKEYERIKSIHRIGEYSKAKGDKTYTKGEIAILIDTHERVKVLGICENGEYLCSFIGEKSGIEFKVEKIEGDRLESISL